MCLSLSYDRWSVWQLNVDWNFIRNFCVMIDVFQRPLQNMRNPYRIPLSWKYTEFPAWFGECRLKGHVFIPSVTFVFAEESNLYLYPLSVFNPLLCMHHYSFYWNCSTFISALFFLLISCFWPDSFTVVLPFLVTCSGLCPWIVGNYSDLQDLDQECKLEHLVIGRLTLTPLCNLLGTFLILANPNTSCRWCCAQPGRFQHDLVLEIGWLRMVRVNEAHYYACSVLFLTSSLYLTSGNVDFHLWHSLFCDFHVW